MNKIISAVFVFLVMFLGVFLFISSDINAKDKVYKIGDRGPAGGWIFYDKGNSEGGWRYLEAAPKDQSDDAEWGCYKKSIPGAKGEDIGNGKSNTQAIVQGCEDFDSAAKIATQYRGGGKSDWFLPSKNELNAYIENLDKKIITNDNDPIPCYWSSSEQETDSRSSWNQQFNTGYDGYQRKEVHNRVRAIRAF